LKHSQVKVTYNPKILSPPICSSSETYRFLNKIWDKGLINLQEQVVFLFLNGNNQVITWRCINTGTDNQSLFDLKLALCIALNCAASKMIISHNHPSGPLYPSRDDINITKRMKSAGNLIDIPVVDHIIVNRANYFSFLDNDLMD